MNDMVKKYRRAIKPNVKKAPVQTGAVSETSTQTMEDYLSAAGNEGLKNFVSGGRANGATSANIPENMSREDQDKIQIYNDAYSNALGIEKRYEQAVLDANKAHDLAGKYLAAQNQAQGLGGLGVSDTSSIRLTSQYQQALSDAHGTRENALQENYANMQDDINTVSGEWASKKEADFTQMKNEISLTDDEDKAKAYLEANGYKEGTDDYNKLMAAWALQYGDSPTTERETLNSYGIEVDDETNTPTGRSYEVKDADAKELALEIQKDENITAGVHSDTKWYNNVGQLLGAGKAGNNEKGPQTKKLTNLLEQSKTWGKEHNGTYVDFNYGKGEAMYVFYNGKWYKTNKTEEALENEGITAYGVGDFS